MLIHKIDLNFFLTKIIKVYYFNKKIDFFVFNLIKFYDK